MIHIAICDDDMILTEDLERILYTQAKQLDISIACDIFYSGIQLVAQKKHYDLIFLDIEMTDMDGISVGKHLRNQRAHHHTQIAYISSKEHYAMQLFQNRPIDFLIKPITPHDVKRILIVITDLLELNMQKTLTFQSDGVFHNVAYQDILYLCSSEHKISIYTTNGCFSLYGKLSDLVQKINNHDFLLIHKSYLVNYQHIAVAQCDSVSLLDGTCLPISQAHRKKIRELLYQKGQQKGHSYD